MESTFIKLKCNPNTIMAKKISVSILVISLPLFYVSFLQIPPSTLIKDTVFWFLMSNSIIIFIAADTGVLFSYSNDLSEKYSYEDLVNYNRVKNTVFVEEQPKELNTCLDVKENLGDDQTCVGENEKPSPSCVKQNSSRDLSTRNIEKVQNNEVNKSIVSDEKLVVHGSVSVIEVEKVPNKEVEKTLVMEKLVDDSVSLANKEEAHEALERENRFRRKVVKGKSIDLNVFNENRITDFHEKPLRRSVTQEKRYNLDQNHEYAKLSDEELNSRIEDFIRRYYREMRLQLSNESG